MSYDPEEDCFTCAQGGKLYLRRECMEEQEGQFNHCLVPLRKLFWLSEPEPVLPCKRRGTVKDSGFAENLLGKAR